MPPSSNALAKVLANEQEVLNEWVQLQLTSSSVRPDLMKESELRAQSSEFVELLHAAVTSGTAFTPNAAAWMPVCEFLNATSRSRAVQGFSATETATFVLSLKQALFNALCREFEAAPQAIGDALWHTTNVVDQLALYTMEAFQKTREEIISRQQQELLELSTPVVELWEGILALPLIGTLDSARTQVVMESLLEAIVRTGAGLAIIDITGVPTVDTLVAQHLLKTVAAARLMGADCIISGIRPQIAQTIVHLGVDLSAVITKATLADAFILAMRRADVTFVKPNAAKSPKAPAE